MRQRYFLLLASVMTTCSIPATAQDRVVWQRIYNQQQNQTYFRTALATNHALRSHRRRAPSSPTRGNRPNATPRPGDTSTSRRIPAGATTFRPVAPSIVPQQMAQDLTANETDRREMQAFFAQCLQNYEANMRRQSQPIRDVARALSYLVGVSYNVFHGGNVLSSRQGAAIRAEMKEALSTDAPFQTMSNREKQKMYESMAIMAEYVAIGAEVAAQKKNHQLADMARDMAKDNLEKVFGTAISNIRVTDQGVRF